MHGKKTSAIADFTQSDSFRKVAASFLSIFIGVAVGALIILVIAFFDGDITIKGGLEGMKLLFLGVFNKGRSDAGELLFGFNGVNIGNMFFRATPVIMTGLSVAFAFKAGLFNIGAPGQYLIGTAATLITALSIPSDVIHPTLIWLLAFFSGMLFGALWGIIPGFFRAYLNINEVLSSIMTNWIAANLVTWIFENSPLRNGAESGKVGYIMKTSANGVMTAKLGLDKLFPGSQLNSGFLVSCLFAVIIYVLISKTVFGFELKACGSNRFAAQYAGIKSKNRIITAMAIAGSLSGAGAALYYLSGNTEFFWSTYQSLPFEGFRGIPIALLALSNPIGVIFSGCFMSALSIAGQQLKNFTAYSEYVTDIIIAVIVYISAFSLILRNLLSRKRQAKESTTTFPVNLAKKEIETENENIQEEE